MGAETVWNILITDAQGFSAAILIDPYVVEARGRRGPLQLRELLFALGADQARLPPIRPVTAIAIAPIGSYEIELLRAPDIDIDIHRAARGQRGHHLALEHRLDAWLRWGQLAGLLADLLALDRRDQVILARLGRGNPPSRNIRLGYPGDRVKNQLTEILIAPIPVNVAAGEAEATSAIGAFTRPGDMLEIALRHRGANGGVAAVGAIATTHGALGRHGAENGSHPLQLVPKAHVEIPLIVDLEGLHATGDRMGRQLFEISNPVRIHRPMGLEIASDPFEEIIPGLALGNLHGVVDTGQPDAFLHKLVHLFEMPIDRVSSAPIHVENNCGGSIENRGVLRPAARVDLRLDSGQTLLESVREIAAATSMLMRTETMAVPAGDKDHRLVSRRNKSGRGQA